jgi:acetyl esterase/lipase
MRRILYSSLAIVFCVFLAVDLRAQDEKKSDAKIRIEKNLVYGKGGDQDMMLDLALPDGKEPRPCIVCVHGGGWRGGQRQDFTSIIKLLAEKGFVAATVSYRLTPKYQFPAQIEDCKAAVRWLRANADKYRIQKDRFGAVGASAGGHLVCLMGTADASAKLEGNGGNAEQSSQVQAVVSFFGPTDFVNKTWTKEVEDFFLVPFLGGSYEEKKDLYRKCSPLEYVTKDAPPFLFFHGTKDTLVGIENSQKLAKKLQEVGVAAELVTMEGDGHGWGGEKMTRTLNRTAQFFEEKLKK